MFNPAAATPSLKIIPMPVQKTAIPAPSSEEAERALLGAVLCDPEQFHPTASIVTAKDFFFIKHEYIWNAIAAVAARFEPIDVVTVGDALHAAHGEKGFLDIGGPAFLTQLLRDAPTAKHAIVYARMIQRVSARRKILKATDELRTAAYDESVDTAALLERFAQMSEEIAAPILSEQIEHISFALNEHMDHVEQAYAHKVNGIPCGLHNLNVMIDGYHRRRVYEVVARTHHGKTAFMLTSALAAAKAGYKVGIFNVADGNRQDVISRLVGMEIGIAPHRIITGKLTQAEYSTYVQAISVLSKCSIYVRSLKGMTPRQLYHEARALQVMNGLDIIFVDYLQRMGDGGAHKTDYARLSYVSQMMTVIAEKLDVPVVAGVQVNRSVQARSDKRPNLSDIKGSGNFEEDADVALLIYREGAENAGVEQPEKTEIKIGKNKVNGQLGVIYTRMNPITTRFWD